MSNKTPESLEDEPPVDDELLAGDALWATPEDEAGLGDDESH